MERALTYDGFTYIESSEKNVFRCDHGPVNGCRCTIKYNPSRRYSILNGKHYKSCSVPLKEVIVPQISETIIPRDGDSINENSEIIRNSDIEMLGGKRLKKALDTFSDIVEKVEFSNSRRVDIVSSAKTRWDLRVFDSDLIRAMDYEERDLYEKAFYIFSTGDCLKVLQKGIPELAIEFTEYSFSTEPGVGESTHLLIHFEVRGSSKSGTFIPLLFGLIKKQSGYFLQFVHRTMAILSYSFYPERILFFTKEDQRKQKWFLDSAKTLSKVLPNAELEFLDHEGTHGIRAVRENPKNISEVVASLETLFDKIISKKIKSLR